MMKRLADLRAWADSLPPPMNTLARIFGCEIALLIVFFAFAFLMFILWVVLHPVIWPKG